MGRVKLKIKKLENTNGRQATYAKRKNGIIKKATEISILCGIDIILLMFSPSGKPSLCRGRSSNFEEVITKFGQKTPQERERRKLESLEALNKTFKKLDHDVNVQEFLGTSSQTIEDLSNQSRLLQTLTSERNKRLSKWTDLGKISNVEQLEQMENSLKESLDHIRTRKENIQKQQLASLQCNNNQFNEMQIPFRMSADQHLQPLSWIANGDSQSMVLPEDSKLLLHSVKSHVGYEKIVEEFISRKDQWNQCLKVLVQDMMSSLWRALKAPLLEVMQVILARARKPIFLIRQENSVLSDLSSTAPGRLQLNGQFPYQPYNFNLLNDMKFQPAAEMNSHENHADFHVNGRFEASRPGYESNHQNWASTSGPFTVTMFDEYLLGQASFPQVHFGFT